MTKRLKHTGVTSRNVRNVEINIDRWLARPEPNGKARKARNRTVHALRNMIATWRGNLRVRKAARRRHLRNERAKLRRRA